MIFWLCFLFCIGYNASPLSRQRHQVQDWHLHHIEPGRRNDFQQIHPKHYTTNVRSINEKFPEMKTKFKNRATSMNNNTIRNAPSLNRTQSNAQEPNVKKADRFSDKITKLAKPKFKAYGSRKKHNLLNWNFRHQHTKENNNQNDKLENIASTKSQVKRQISNNANHLDLSNFEQEVHQNPKRADDILKQNLTGKSNGNKRFGLDDGEELQKASRNVGAGNKGNRFGAHHHRRPHKKHQKHIFKGSGENFQEKNHKTPIFQPAKDLADGQSPDEMSKPSLGEDIGTVQGFSKAPLKKEADNSSENNKTFEQNNSLNNQPQPIKKDEPNISEGKENVKEPNFPLIEKSNPTDNLKRQDPSNSNKLTNENDGKQDRQMDESYIAQHPEYTDQPLDYESVSDFGETTQEGQEDASSTEENANESTDLYQPIHFKLRDESETIRRSMFNHNKTESPQITKQVESKDIRDDQDQYFDNEMSNSGNKTEFYPLSNEILTTYFETEYSVTPFTMTQVTTNYDTTIHSLKKKSSSSENFHKQQLRSKDNYGNQTSRLRKSYFTHKRSHQNPTSSNDISSIAKRNNDITKLDLNSDIQAQEPKNVNLKNIHKKDLHNKREKTETSTSIIQEYAFPTLGIPDKILKSVSDSKKRSSNNNPKSVNNSNDGTFHANEKRFQNSPSNKIDQTETNIWKKPSLESKISRNINKSISTTQYPLQVNETYEPDKVLRDVPDKDELSDQNDPQNDVIDKVTRTKEKSTQTIITDGQSDNIIEKKEEKVVDRIQIQKQPLASGEGIENQKDNDASDISEGNENYPNENENNEYPDNVPPESDVGIDNKKKISNALKTDEFKNLPPNSKSDHRDTTSKTNVQNKLNSNPKPVSSMQSPPIPNGAQSSNNANGFDEKEIAKEFENLEPPNEDEYSYQESTDESQLGGQQSSFSENDNVNGPEQSTNNFIDLADQEGEKDTVLEDLNKFPTAKQNNKPKNYQTNLGYEYRGQKGNFYEFSTVLPNLNDMGEFHREEKVERQSKIIHKNHGIMTNGSSSLFGEKKIEVKDNKQNYHETFMEEKGESKFPSEPEDTELQKREDQNGTFFDNVDQAEMDRRNPTSKKNKKNAGYNSYDEYYTEDEDDPDSTSDSDEKEYEDEYLVEPADVLQNEGRIDGISKRSGAFFDTNKSMNNSKALEPTVTTPNNVSQSNNFTKKEITGNEVITTKLFDDVSGKIGDHGIQISKKNSNAPSNDQMKPSSSIANNEQNFLQPQITNRQIKPETPPCNQTEVGHNENHESEMSIGNKRDDVPLNVSTSGNTGSGNIEYVTISSTTDKDSQFTDFLNIEDERRQSRQLPSHQDDVYHRQKKHSSRHKTRKFSPNYRINRNSNRH
ncbi:hypothetical protein JTE90_003036 [Oedothorax gibbosus]|uniref:Uncharacterized protein n=1 Tax=Oedothorax gibbosus TaxID=931172 RepID=A0AAV6VDG6_9ARAC|nr:hypothetical protein JTE90_003036 [Oedothorax gibbosus]